MRLLRRNGRMGGTRIRGGRGLLSLLLFLGGSGGSIGYVKEGSLCSSTLVISMSGLACITSHPRWILFHLTAGYIRVLHRA